jgi:hypothetical protein
MPVSGIAGKLARGGPVRIFGSFIADGDIPFGKVVMLGTDPTRQVKAYSGSAVPIGIALADDTKGFTRDANGNPVQALTYKDGDPVQVLKQGTVFVTVAANVTAGKAAKVKADGDIVDESGTGTTIPGSIFRTSASAGQIAELEINLP